MKARFEKESGHRILVDALKDQKLVNGNIKLAEDISAVGELLEVKRDAVIIEQGAADNDVFLILTGSFAISVNGRQWLPSSQLSAALPRSLLLRTLSF
jgi:hypothetical protein